MALHLLVVAVVGLLAGFATAAQPILGYVVAAGSLIATAAGLYRALLGYAERRYRELEA
jgi:hypothetical protein